MSTAPTLTRIDGVEVHWRLLPGRLRAHLVFRAGAVDEQYHTLGMSHLVEHLAFAEAEDLDPDVNGGVGVQTTHFQVEGSPEKVVRQLHSICRSLSALADGSLPARLIDHEKKILAAEGDAVALPEPAVAEALTVRYGLRGPGLAGVSPALAEKITEEEVRAFAAERFTRGNAVLVLTGEPPADLSLPLPDGGRVAVPEHAPVPLELPGEYTTGGEHLVLSFQVPGSQAGLDAVAQLALTALRRRCYRELRRDAGLVYDIDAGVALQPRSGVAAIVVRTAPSSVGQAAEGVLGILREVRDHGVSKADLDAALQEPQDRLEDPEHAAAELVDAVESVLLDEPRVPLAGLPEAVRGVTAEHLRDWLGQLEVSLAVGIPAEAYEQAGTSDPEPGARGLVTTVMGPVAGPEITGTVYPVRLLARFAGVPKGLRLVVGERGVMITDGSFRRALGWDQVVAVEEDTTDPDVPQLNVVGVTGEVIEVPVAVLKGGDKAVEQILGQVPERRRCTGSPPVGSPPADDAAR